MDENTWRCDEHELYFYSSADGVKKMPLFEDRALTTDTGHPLAHLSRRQVPRWSLTCIGEALVLIPQATDSTER